MADTTTEAVHPAAETARLTADVVLFGVKDGVPYVLLIKRRWDPFEGRWALPGGHVDVGEDTAVAAARELAEETGLAVERLDYVDAYAEPGRDPRGRYVTFAYVAVVQGLPEPTAADDAAEAEWVPLREALRDEFLAFDHSHIVADSRDLAL